MDRLPTFVYFLTITLLGFGVVSQTTDNSGCKINLESRTGKYLPFFLNGQTHNVLYPTKTRILETYHGDSIILHCHGSKVKHSTEYSFASGRIAVPFTCSDGKWMSDGHSANVELIECESIMYPSLERIKNQCNPIGADGRKTDLESLVLVQMGFNFTSHYSPLITLCHDEQVYGTIWTKHTIRGESIDLRDGTSYRPSFRTNIGSGKDFYPFTTMTGMNTQYSKSTQVQTMNQLLGKNTIVVDGQEVPIIDESGTNYFSKGHLSPDAAFILVPEQDATYFYFNAAPQFQSFNNRNWKSIEFKTRNWAADNSINLDVYTGTYGVLQYENTLKSLIDIYLFPQEGDVPAPNFFWKVLHDTNSNEAIAFVGLNNPHERKVPEGICTNVCDQTKFADEDYSNFEAGYVLCCELSDLRNVIPSVPDLSSEGTWPSLMGKVAVTKPPVIEEGCQINLNNLQNKYPPIFASNGKFIYPSFKNDAEERITVIPEGSEAEMFCHRRRGNSLLYGEETTSDIKSMILTCTNEKLLHSGKAINPADYRCRYINQPALVITRESDCALEGADKRTNQLNRIAHVSVGWFLAAGFTQQMDLCIDELLYATLWSRYTVHGKYIDFRDTETPRISFKVDETGKKRLFGKRTTSKLNGAYSKITEKETLTFLTGHTEINGHPMIETSRSSTVFLARGHLSPDAGFVNYAEQLGTYFFINVAPQYQSFNNGNWKALEMATRDLAEKAKSDIEVTTGTYDTLTYYNIKIVLLEGKFIPAPLLFWKVLYHKESNKAVAFVGSNDVLSATTPTPICKDVCGQLPWVDWDRTNVMKGYMYCCEVKELRKVISYVPDLDVPLLTDVV